RSRARRRDRAARSVDHAQTQTTWCVFGSAMQPGSTLLGSSVQNGGGGLHGSGRHPRPVTLLLHDVSSCVPAGQTPLAGISSHWGSAPPQHGSTQYCDAPHVVVPQVTPSLPGGQPSAFASTFHLPPLHVAVATPPWAQS